MLYVSEMFASIQGEGMYMGRPAYFIRLAGCNVCCEFCDTADAQSKDNSLHLSNEDVAVRCIDEYHKTLSHMVVFTGGEPTLQCHDMNDVIHYLQKAIPLIKIQVETSGSVEPDNASGAQCLFNSGIEISLSPKRIPFMHPEWLLHASQLKVLVDFDGPILPKNFHSLEFMLQIFGSTWHKGKALYFQPVALGDGNKKIIPADSLQKALELARLHNGLLGVQLHKYLGVQ